MQQCECFLLHNIAPDMAGCIIDCYQVFLNHIQLFQAVRMFRVCDVPYMLKQQQTFDQAYELKPTSDRNKQQTSNISRVSMGSLSVS